MTIKTYKKSTLSKQRYYYIVRCYDKDYEIDYKYLEQHLQKLHLKPDTKAATIINRLDNAALSRKKIPLNKKCDITDHKILPQFNKNILSASIFFLNSIENNVNKRFSYYPKYLTNKINYSIIDKIFNKYNVLDRIKSNNPKLEPYLPKTFKINELNKYEFPKWYILRPIDSFGGTNIFYINSEKQLQNKITYYKNTSNYKGIKYGNDVAASEYIHNPLLFKNKKFHLRLYMLISITSEKHSFNSFLLNFSKILTAKEPFDMLEPFSTAKHDTHVKSTDDDYTFHNDFNSANLNVKVTKKELDKLWSKIRDIMKAIAIEMKKVKEDLIYTDDKNSFYIFGVDMMVRDTLDPVFIEINYSPGVGFKKDTSRDHFSKIYADWINETVLEPLFAKHSKSVKLHPTYLDI